MLCIGHWADVSTLAVPGSAWMPLAVLAGLALVLTLFAAFLAGLLCCFNRQQSRVYRRLLSAIPPPLPTFVGFSLFLFPSLPFSKVQAVPAPEGSVHHHFGGRRLPRLAVVEEEEEEVEV
jgi:hypothetical protein